MTIHPDLPYEQARNREYLEKLDKKLQKNPLREVSRNVIWIDSIHHQMRAAGFHHPLLGRVGCDTDDPDLRDFYIGPRFVQDGDLQVYSFAAPVAQLFYQPDSEGGPDVVVRRTFTHKVDEISDLDDEWTREHASSPFLDRGLEVPAPTRSTTSRRQRAAARAPQSPEPNAEAATTTSDTPETISARRAASTPARRKGEGTDPREGMRAQEAVLKRLTQPREDRLQTVLALLQPDQHVLVSWPVDQNLAVQGHPGTGKTIVAAYRAAYLVNPALYDHGAVLENRSGRPLRVLVVGPTEGYVSHVEGLLQPLASPDQVKVTHLAELMKETTGLKGPWHGGIGGEHDDVDAQARLFTERAARLHESTGRWKEGKSARRDNVKAIYDMVTRNGTPDHPLVADPDQIAWMRKLPPFDKAFQRRYLPLMAQCRLAYNPIPRTSKYDHIIVDEAQDVSPIEWNVLDQYLHRDGYWTLVGDMNQRRSDVTYGSWTEIADHLALAAEESFAPRIMHRGYRSTGAILKFADRLLPARDRGNQTVQAEGVPVGIHRVTKQSDLWSRTVSVASGLKEKYQDGTTAIITVHPGEVIRDLGRRGWKRQGGNFSRWKMGEQRLFLFAPEDARGLEFDAVVVAEPGAFPENLGRNGQLYTSLTRANRELAVVWHRDLPDPLRRAARS